MKLISTLTALLLGCSLGCLNVSNIETSINALVDIVEAKNDIIHSRPKLLLNGLVDPVKHVRDIRYHEAFENKNTNYGVPLVNIAGIWGTICFDGLDEDTRDFLCRQLHFPDSYWGSPNDFYQHVSHFHQSLIEYPTLLNGMKCIKHASEFDDCSSKPIGFQQCQSQQDLFLGCIPIN